MDPLFALLLLPGFLIALTVHEFAHAFSASLLGDHFARRQGRVSLNPMRHLSPLGTLVLLVLPFGWGRPVPVNLYNFRRPRRDYLITSLAGPAANLILLGICLGLMRLTMHPYRYGPLTRAWMNVAHSFLGFTALINAILAAFNLIPIPPLDGSKIWPCLFPRLRLAWGRKTTWTFMLILLALMWTGSLSPVVGGVINAVQRIMPVSDHDRFMYWRDEGDEALDAGQYAQAERAFTEAIEIHPAAIRCYFGRANARVQQQNWAGALADATRAWQLIQEKGDSIETAAESEEILAEAKVLSEAIAVAQRSSSASRPATVTDPTEGNDNDGP